VPELSRFFGIIIRMFAEPGSPHHAAHFHAYYQGEVGIFSFDPVDNRRFLAEEAAAAGGSVGGIART
jgi:hypothetical protein